MVGVEEWPLFLSSELMTGIFGEKEAAPFWIVVSLSHPIELFKQVAKKKEKH